MKKILLVLFLFSGTFVFCQGGGYNPPTECNSLTIKNEQNKTNQIRIEVYDYGKSQGYQEYYNFNIGPNQSKRVDVSMFTEGSLFKVWARNSERGSWYGIPKSTYEWEKCTYSFGEGY